MKALITFLIVTSSILFADIEPNEIFNSETRFVTSLSGKWQSLKDGSSVEVTLPKAEYKSGDISYFKKIKLPKGISSKQLHFYFLGISSDIEINVNGSFLGKYIGGMTPFWVKIPSSYVNSDTLEIELKVLEPIDNTKLIRTKDLYAKKNNYGILRDFYLIGTDPVWVNSIRTFTIKRDNQRYLDLNFKVSTSTLSKKSEINQSSNLLVRAEFLGNDSIVYSERFLNISFEEDRVIDTNLTFNISSLQMWTVDNPKLYDIRLTVNTDLKLHDDITFKAGFKNISLNESQLILNNEKFQIKAVDFVEEFNESPILKKESIKSDIDKIKKMGANAIRFKYTPPHPLMTKLCDSAGLLMFIDLPVYHLPKEMLSTKEVKVRIANIASRYYDYYLSKASSLAFGLPDGITINNSQIFEYKKTKNTFLYRFLSPETKLASDYADFLIIQIPDFSKADELDALLSEINKPFLLNYGSEIQINNNNGYSDKLSSDYQAHFLRSIYKLEYEYLFGHIFKTYNDYTLENPILSTNNKDKFLRTSGLTSSDRLDRLSFETATALFKSEKEPLLNAGSEQSLTNVVFIIVGLGLLLIFAFLLNRLRRFREYISRALFRPYNFYSDIRDHRLISSTQTFVLSLIVSFSIGIFLANVLHFNRLSENLEYLLMILVPDVNLRISLISFIWEPELLMLFISFICFLLIYITSIIIKIASFSIKNRIFLPDAITISVWSLLPLILLMPIGIIAGRLFLLNDLLIPIFLGFFILMLIWSINRILKATRVVFDVRAWKVYGIGFLIILLILMIPISVMQLNYSVVQYLSYYFENNF